MGLFTWLGLHKTKVIPCDPKSEEERRNLRNRLTNLQTEIEVIKRDYTSNESVQSRQAHS